MATTTQKALAEQTTGELEALKADLTAQIQALYAQIQAHKANSLDHLEMMGKWRDLGFLRARVNTELWERGDRDA